MKGLNEKHSDYEEYKRLATEAFERRVAAENRIKSKYPDWRGHGHPEGERLAEIRSEFLKELEALKNKYKDVFEEEP